MIIVVNKKDNLHNGQPYKVYIGRPSPLGNPFSVEKYGRGKAIELFEKRLLEAMDPTKMDKHLPPDLVALRKAVKRLEDTYAIHNMLVLECWCKPKACHGDVLKKRLED
jgi:hypothetical protein